MKKWLFYIAVVAGGYLLKTAMEPDRDDTGAIVAEGSLDAFSIKVGDCFNDAVAGGEEGVEVSDVPAVPCSQPHDNEVYAVFDVTMPSFPGKDAMAQTVHDTCLARFEAFVGRDYQSSALDILTLYPTQESWDQNDREGVCAVYDISLNKLTGSTQGLAL